MDSVKSKSDKLLARRQAYARKKMDRIIEAEDAEEARLQALQERADAGDEEAAQELLLKGW